MLNRRHLRVKALQVLYAYQQTDQKSPPAFEKQLLKNIDTVYGQYLFLLLLLIESIPVSTPRATRSARPMSRVQIEPDSP